MKEFLLGLALVVGFVVVCLGAAWVAQGNDFFLYKTFAPQYAQVQRQTFEQTKSYQQGTIEELQNMQFEYEKAPESSKPALRKIILHRAADYPNQLPPDLDSFIRQLKREESSSL